MFFLVKTPLVAQYVRSYDRVSLILFTRLLRPEVGGPIRGQRLYGVGR